MTILMVSDWKKAVSVQCLSRKVKYLITLLRAKLMAMMMSVMAADNTLNLTELRDRSLASASSFILYCATLNPKIAPKEQPSRRMVIKKVITLL